MQTRTSLLAKSTSILGATVALLFASQSMAQVNYSFNFDANSTGWTGNFARQTTAAACTGSAAFMRRNIWASATTGAMISPSVGTALGGNVCTVTFDYRVHLFNVQGSPAPAPWGTIDVQYGATATGPWTTISTITSEAQTTSCLTKSFNFTPPAGPLFMRWNCNRVLPVAPDIGDNHWNFDNISVVELVPCATPAPGNTVGPAFACPGSNVTLSLQNSTGGQTVSYQWYASTVSASGPWTPVGTNLATYTAPQSVDTWYYCDVTCSVGPVTTASNVLAVPVSVATFPQDWSTGVVAPNCWATSGLVGASVPDYNAVSAFGVGTGSVRINFFLIAALNQPTLTSPEFAPLAGTQFLSFDVAGATYTGGEIDQIALEESNDGGLTWATIVTMDNSVGGQLNTGGALAPSFVPTAAQWVSLGFPVSAGTNKVRFRGISDFGNNVYIDNVNITPGLPAYHATVGQGCYDEFRSALVQEFAGSPAAKTALDGNSLLFVNTGSSYTAFWSVGGGASYVAPTGGATTLVFADDDDGEITITPSIATPIPGGTTANWTVSVNGILTAGAVANNLTDFSPSRADVAAAAGLAFYTWRDWNVGELGSGPVQTEEVGNMLYITWNGVEAYGTPSPNVGTWQFQVDMSTGNVNIVWVSFETSTSTAPVIVGATTAGTSTTPPSSDLSIVTPFSLGTDMFPMTLSAAGAPINGGPAPTYTITNIPEYFPGAGFSTLAVVFGLTQIPGGIDLGTIPGIDAPGCFGYASPDIIVIIGVVPFAPASFPIAWNIPTTPGQLWMQAISEFLPFTLPNGQNAGGKVSSNALEIYIENF
jgi:hypothetical protein